MTSPARQGSDPVREAAQELLTALDDTYPEDEIHLSPLEAMSALRAALAAATPAPSEDRLRMAIEAAMTAMGLEGNRPNSVYAAEIAYRVASLSPANVSTTGSTCELHHVHSETEPCSAVIDRWDAAWAEAAERDRHPDGPRNEMGRPERVETPRERAAREKRDAG